MLRVRVELHRNVSEHFMHFGLNWMRNSGRKTRLVEPNKLKQLLIKCIVMSQLCMVQKNTWNILHIHKILEKTSEKTRDTFSFKSPVQWRSPSWVSEQAMQQRMACGKSINGLFQKPTDKPQKGQLDVAWIETKLVRKFRTTLPCQESLHIKWPNIWYTIKTAKLWTRFVLL